MDIVMRLFSIAAGALVLGLAVIFAFNLFIVLFLLGLGLAAMYWIRAFFIEKEILNPRPGVHVEEMDEQVTIIEGDYVDVSEKKQIGD